MQSRLLEGYPLRKMADSSPPFCQYNEPALLVRELRLKYRKELALYLNPDAPLHNNWCELADHLGFSFDEIKEIERRGTNDSPTLLLLQELVVRTPRSTVDSLVPILKKMNRNDCVAVVEQALADYRETHPPPPPSYDSLQQSSHEPPDTAVQRGEGLEENHTHQSISTASTFSPPRFEHVNEFLPNDGHIFLNPRRTAIQESVPKLDIYDVYLSCDSEDWHFGKHLGDVLRRNGFSVYEYEEDSDPGEDEPLVKGNMIMEKCRKVILVMSPSYIESEYKMMEASLARSKCPAPKKNFLIPIIYKECKVPNFLKNIHWLDYAKLQRDPARLEDFFWKKLFRSLQNGAPQ